MTSANFFPLKLQ